MMTKTRAVWMGLAAALACGSGTRMAAATDPTPSDKNLVDVVLKNTARFRDPAEAEGAGYGSANACVSGPEVGAMGVHFIKGAILFDGKITPEEPEALIYEIRNGRARLVGVEYIVIASQWHAENGAAPPVILGQQTHLVSSPNRYGLDPFYELHVWAWRGNPNGTFVDWNPLVSCAGFEPEDTPEAAHVHGGH